MPVAPATAAVLTDALTRAGVDVPRLGVGPLYDDPEMALLWARAIERTGRRTLPLEVGLGLPLGSMGVVDYLAASSATVGAALTVTQQVFPLVAPGVQLLFEALRGGVRRVVVVDQPPFPGQAESDLLVLGILLNRLRQLSSRPLQFPLVELVEPEPSLAARPRWLALLAVPRAKWSARRSALHLSPSDWTAPLRNADPRLLATLKGMVGVEQRSADALLVAMRALAVQHLPGQLTLEQAGPALGLGRRTLQRKLAACGTSLTVLVDEARRDRAELLVGEGLLTLGEVATRVGFAEQASFTRAWRRWFGAAPSRTRRRS
jgi:AraC-like DNA-binding protein